MGQSRILQLLFIRIPIVSGVRFPGLTHPGLIGTAPSKELLEIWNTREAHLEKEGADAITLGAVLHTRPLANLPLTKGALLGKVGDYGPTMLFIDHFLEERPVAGSKVFLVSIID